MGRGFRRLAVAAIAAVFLLPSAKAGAAKKSLSLADLTAEPLADQLDGELQIQPREKHGFHGAESLNFRNRAILEFFEQNLK